MTRLPTPGSDADQWGQILNDFLAVEHNSDGTLKASGSLASKANDAGVVHLAGTETITGVKTFTHPITVPTPVNTTDTATKQYVDAVTANLSGKTDKATLTAKGDLYAASAAGTPARVGVGASGSILTADSTQAVGMRWAPPANAPFFNVKDYGATGDGTTDDTASIAAAITAAASAGGGMVFVPQGTYMVSATLALTTNITLAGAGHGATLIKRSANIPIISVYGPATTNHVLNIGIRDLAVHGNDMTATAIDVVYVSMLYMTNVSINSVSGIGMDLVEVWDSRFINLFFLFAGSTSAAVGPALEIRCARAASGFGSSTDNLNECFFWGLHLEHFRAGAIRVEPGVSSNGPNGVYFSGLKMETGFAADTAPVFYVDANTARVYVDKVYVYVGDLFSGSATVGIQWNSDGGSSIRDGLIGNGSSTTLAKGIDLNVFGDATCAVDNIRGSYGTSPTVAHVNVSSGNSYTISDIRSNATTNLAGVGTGTIQNIRPIKAVAGVVSDASFPASPPIGTMAVDTSNSQLYIKTGSTTWKKVAIA